jgi:hypothetical protein
MSSNFAGCACEEHLNIWSITPLHDVGTHPSHNYGGHDWRKNFFGRMGKKFSCTIFDIKDSSLLLSLHVASVCVGCDCTTDKSKIHFCMYIPTGMSNIKIIVSVDRLNRGKRERGGAT